MRVGIDHFLHTLADARNICIRQRLAGTLLKITIVPARERMLDKELTPREHIAHCLVEHKTE